MRNHHGRLLAPAVCLLAAWGPQARSEEKERAPKAEKKEPKKGPGKGKTAVKSDVPIESLIEWNAAELFGNGKVTIRGEQVEVLCEKDGHVASAFEGTNIMDSRHEKMKGATRRFIQYGDQKDGEKLLPGLAAIAMGEGTWTSRFRLAGETRVSFDMRIPNLLTEQSTMKIRIGWDGSAGYETTFFNSIAFIASGIPKGLIAASDPKHKRHAFHWFQRGAEPVPVEFGIEGGQAVARYSRKDLVTIPKAKDRGGKVQISFKKILFTLQNLRVSGKLDLEWCSERLADLEEKGRLVTEPPKPPAAPGAAAAPPPEAGAPAPPGGKEEEEEGADEGGAGGEEEVRGP